MKEGSICHCLYVNVTNNYVAFKIEEGKFLGGVKTQMFKDKTYYAVEHYDDDVNYLQMDDILATEKDAYKALIKALQDKIDDMA